MLAMLITPKYRSFKTIAWYSTVINRVVIYSYFCSITSIVLDFGYDCCFMLTLFVQKFE